MPLTPGTDMHSATGRCPIANGQAARRIVLGDWDRQGWALQVDEQGFQLAAFDFVPPVVPALPQL